MLNELVEAIGYEYLLWFWTNDIYWERDHEYRREYKFPIITERG